MIANDDFIILVNYLRFKREDDIRICGHYATMANGLAPHG